MQPLTLFGPFDDLMTVEVAGQPLVVYVVLGLVVLNMITRALAHRTHVRQAEDGPEAISHSPLHAASTVLLILGSFYFLTLEHHAGIVLSTLVVGLFLTDFFEFESRRVEARRGIELERPKGAITASVLVLAYAAYLSLFFLIAPAWNAVV
ncbi:hypothetical protein BRC90_09515 [Halobacteriales archaeon QS_4_69_34]|nr:MAG: hypothetical protein BRC90_09515 [Halobacteriales archaeon QS_4_69_34]